MSFTCVECGQNCEVLDDDARGEWEEIMYYCENCNIHYTRRIDYKPQSDIVANDCVVKDSHKYKVVLTMTNIETYGMDDTDAEMGAINQIASELGISYDQLARYIKDSHCCIIEIGDKEVA